MTIYKVIHNLSQHSVINGEEVEYREQRSYEFLHHLNRVCFQLK
jgi:hypothetical protein